MAFARLIAVVLAILVVGCSNNETTATTTTTNETHLFRVSGTVDGLDGLTLTLFLNGRSATNIGDGAFSFRASLADGDPYEVTSTIYPTFNHTCTIERGRGTIAGADATGVAVHCLSNDANLADLSTSAAPLSTKFSSATGAYSAVTVVSGIFPVTATVTATARDRSARILIAGVAAVSGSPTAPFPLKPGPTPIDIVVTAADGTTKHYALVISGRASDYAKASNTRRTASFGYAVALSGNTLAVGSYAETSNATGVNGDQMNGAAAYSGAVYIFTRTGTEWSQQAYVKASNTRAYAYFGFSLALAGDTLAVGSYAESSSATGVNGNQSDASASYSGAVYVFTRKAGSWSQEAYIKASNSRYGLQFGKSVALSGDTLAVGADGESSNATGLEGDQADVSAPQGGAVYVFTRAGTVWSQEAYVKASNTRAYAAFGGSVALFANTLAVGSQAESSSATGVNGSQADTTSYYAGAVYVFERAAGAWSQQAYIKASNTRQYAYFGFSVALAGDTLAVGSFGESSGVTGVGGDQTDMSASSAGAVYVFARSAGTWSQEAYIKASNTRANASFGRSVALFGDALAVGAIGESSKAIDLNGNQRDTSASQSGAVYVFRRAGALWSQQSYVKASNTRAVAQFGDSVALSADTLVSGAYGESSSATGMNGDESDTSSTYSGAAYIFR